MKISMRKLSEMTGYSPATISNALNHKRGVNAETAEKIIAIAKETGYIPETVVRKIKLVIFKRNGLIIDDSPFFHAIINGFEQECRNNGFEMVISNVDKRDEDYEKQVHSLIDQTEFAIVLLGTEMIDGDLDIFRGAKCPIVILDYSDDSMQMDSVAINNQDSVVLAMRYLVDRGHTKISYLRGSYRIKAFRERLQGYRILMQKKKLPYDDKNIITLSTTINGAYRDMLQYLDKKPDLPTAFMADNDMIAIGAMKALQERGVRIPEDVSIVGFDDISFSEISSPRLTTIRVPNIDMGRLAVRRVIERLDGKTDGVIKLLVCTTFVERDTVIRI